METTKQLQPTVPVAPQQPRIINIHSAAIQIENKITLKQRQAWFYLLYKALPMLDIEETHQIELSELTKGINYKNTNPKHLRGMLRGLRAPVSWNIFDKDKGEIWGDGVLLADIEVLPNTGVCEYSFSPKFKKRFLNPRMYVKLNLLISREFQSKHSLNIYVLCLDYIYKYKNYGEKIFTVAELRQYLGLDDHEYSLVGDVNRRIIKKAVEDINKDTDMNLDIIPIKKEKKVVAFRFCMSIKDEYLRFYHSYKSEQGLSNKPVIEVQAEPEEEISISNQDLHNFLGEYEISLLPLRSKLRELAAEINKERLESYLLYVADYVKRAEKKGTIDSVSGLFVSLIQNGSQLGSWLYKLEMEHQKKREREAKLQEELEKHLQHLHSDSAIQHFKKHLEVHYTDYEGVVADILAENPFLKARVQTQKQLFQSHATMAILYSKAEERFNYCPIKYETWLDSFLKDPENKERLEEIKHKINLEIKN